MKHVVLVGGHDETFTHFTNLPLDFSVLHLRESIGPNLRSLTDEIYPLDDFSPDSVLTGVAHISESKPIDYLFSFTEDGLLPTARAARRLGIDGIAVEPCELCIDKQAMRAHLVDSEFAVRSATCRTATDVRRFHAEHGALVLKHPRGSGSEDVFVIRDQSEVQVALDTMAAEHFTMLAEEYLPGREVSVETLSIHGYHRTFAVTSKKLYRDTLAEEQHIQSPHNVDADTFHRIEKYCDRLLTLIGHRHGPCHIELKITGDEFKLIEINNRVGGDYIGLLVELTTGISLFRDTLRCLTNSPERTTEMHGKQYRFAASHMFYNEVDVSDLRHNLSEVNIARLHMGIRQADVDRPLTNDDKIGWVVFATDDHRQFCQSLEYLDSVSR
ncbi:ATP-grasp domain-containing protein [Mycolicibacterium boenickei]